MPFVLPFVNRAYAGDGQGANGNMLSSFIAVVVLLTLVLLFKAAKRGLSRWLLMGVFAGVLFIAGCGGGGGSSSKNEVVQTC